MHQAVSTHVQKAHFIAACNNNQKAGSRIQNQYVRLIPLPQNKEEVPQLLELKPASVQNTKLPEKSNPSQSIIVASPLHDKDINPVLLMKHLLSLKSLTSQTLSLKVQWYLFWFFLLSQQNAVIWEGAFLSLLLLAVCILLGSGSLSKD